MFTQVGFSITTPGRTTPRIPKAIAILIAKGEIKPVTMHSKQQIYTRATNDVDA